MGLFHKLFYTSLSRKLINCYQTHQNETPPVASLHFDGNLFISRPSLTRSYRDHWQLVNLGNFKSQLKQLYVCVSWHQQSLQWIYKPLSLSNTQRIIKGIFLFSQHCASLKPLFNSYSHIHSPIATTIQATLSSKSRELRSVKTLSDSDAITRTLESEEIVLWIVYARFQ